MFNVAYICSIRNAIGNCEREQKINNFRVIFKWLKNKENALTPTFHWPAIFLNGESFTEYLECYLITVRIRNHHCISPNSRRLLKIQIYLLLSKLNFDFVGEAQKWISVKLNFCVYSFVAIRYELMWNVKVKMGTKYSVIERTDFRVSKPKFTEKKNLCKTRICSESLSIDEKLDLWFKLKLFRDEKGVKQNIFGICLNHRTGQNI